MKTVQMTLDDDLVSKVDWVAKKMGVSRSAFTSRALRRELQEIATKELEEKHRQGYVQKPVKRGEFSVSESEQVWIEP